MTLGLHQGHCVAFAGDSIYSFGDWFRDDLSKTAIKHPGHAIHLVDQATGIAFAGFVPADYNGKSIELVLDGSTGKYLTNHTDGP